MTIIILAALSDESAEKKTSFEHLEEEWSDKCAFYIILMIIGLLAVWLLTSNLNRRSGWFAIWMSIFMVYQGILTFLLTFHLLYGMSLKYGKQFGRGYQVFNKNTRRWETIFDDGTYIIKDNVVVGRQSYSDAEFKESILY